VLVGSQDLADFSETGLLFATVVISGEYLIFKKRIKISRNLSASRGLGKY
jgi:hypothetical protein